MVLFCALHSSLLFTLTSFHIPFTFPSHSLHIQLLTISLLSTRYIPREWMLVDAYTAAQHGDMAPAQSLISLFERPYAEQSREQTQAYYRKAPEGSAYQVYMVYMVYIYGMCRYMYRCM